MLPDWARSFYQPHGGDPFLFHVVYGSVDLTAPLSSSSYHSAVIPDGIETMHYTAKKHPEMLSSFREGYLWQHLESKAPGFARQIAASAECVLLRGSPSDSTNLNCLRDAIGLLTPALDHGGLCVYDPQMFHWWQPEEWRQRIFTPASPVPTHHAIILASEEEAPGLTWFHTRGMRKFGRPDLSLHNASPSHHAAAINLFNRFIEHQAFGGVVPEGQPIRMATLPQGLTCHHAGDIDDPDFNNAHIEIRWPAKT